MDRLDAMSLFLAAADAGSFSAASRAENVPLATLSRKIAELESHLGIKLFTRTSRHLAVTEAGRAYALAARQILETLREAERAAAGEYALPKGELVISASLVFGRHYVTPVVAEFLAAHPGISVQLALSDSIVNLLEEPIDCAIRIGELPDSRLRASRIGAARRVVCASPAYLAARGTPLVPGDLATHDCITYVGWMQPESWRFGGQQSVRVRSRLTLNSAEAALDAAAAGIGICSALSYQTGPLVRAGILTLLLESFEPPPAPISLVTNSGRFEPQKLRIFRDFALPRLRARLALAT
jgi:DNA-binding transcriptional LysR family regulator